MITLRAVDEQNREDVLALELYPEQSGFVESTRECIEEAGRLPVWKPTALYAEEELIGFAMYGFWKNEGENGRMWLDRFMIDYRYQGKGLGKQSLKAILDHLFETCGCSTVYLSLYEDNRRAEALYQNAGFEYNGETDIHGELVMELPKDRWEP